jgi:hypothetical protein
MTNKGALDVSKHLPRRAAGLPILYDDAMISRDGKWTAWTWYRAGPTADVYVVPTDGSAAPLCLTDTGEDTELVAWTPDSRPGAGQARSPGRRARAAVSG